MPLESVGDEDTGDDDYPPLPPDQLRRLVALDRALEHHDDSTARPDHIIATARIFDAFIANG